MVERADILTNAANLKEHIFYEEPTVDAGQVWTGEEYNASFELVRPGAGDGPLSGRFLGFNLQLRGDISGREKLRAEFINAFGEPEFEFEGDNGGPQGEERPQYISWDGKVLDNRQVPHF